MSEIQPSRSDRRLAFSLFSKLTETTPLRAGERSWSMVQQIFESHFSGPYKEQMPGFCPVRFNPGTTRADVNVVAISCLVLDLDGIPLDAIRGAISQYEWVAHSTHSHTPARQCSRVIFPLTRDVFPAEWSRFWSTATNELTGGLADKACKNPSRFYYLPSVHPERAADAFHEHNEGTWLNPDAFLANVCAAVTGADPGAVNWINGAPSDQAAALESNLGAGKVDLDAVISEGSRNDGLTRVAGHFAHAGLTGEDLFERVQAHNVAKCKPPLDRLEVRTICSSISKREAEARATAADTLEAALRDLNGQFAWIQTPPAIWRIASREFVPVSAFRIDQGNRQFLSGKTYVELGTAWLKWPERRQHSCLAFEPQEPMIMANGALNLWEGFAFAAAPGDAGPWLTLMTHLFPDPSACRWIQQWLAHSIQHPGTKKHSAIVCWSPSRTSR
ncbi:primase alpha helix C-terminal domain-containing protein [Paraburkholderia sp. A1RI-2L]|uniref:primase alpha helix C-terminal domain-containing protein n=1 Tax=Paraburkholderia sp. A1RI-2L TaxID=3028367 RepID=UPI003B7FADC5